MERTLVDGMTVKWCSECGFWGDHLRAGHIVENAVGAKGGQLCGEIASDEDTVGNNDEKSAAGMTAAYLSDSHEGPFTRLRLSRLI